MKRHTELTIARATMLAGALIIVISLIGLLGCQSSLSAADQRFIEDRFKVMAALSKGALPEPEIRWTYDPDFPHAAWTECLDWSVTLNARVNLPEFMAFTIVPHEYAHLLSCHYRGNMGVNPHDDWWRQAVIKLGGDPDYV